MGTGWGYGKSMETWCGWEKSMGMKTIYFTEQLSTLQAKVICT